jgi:hypothetical protein
MFLASSWPDCVLANRSRPAVMRQLYSQQRHTSAEAQFLFDIQQKGFQQEIE